MQRRAVLFFTVLSVILGGCATITDTSPATPDIDDHIVGIMMEANNGEVQQGNAAATRATSADVRSFAQMMVTDHTSALNAVRDTAARGGITPAENDTTAALRSGTPQVIANLGTWSGADYDRGYMQYQIDLHQWLLTALDTHLIPGARSRDLRTLLETQRTAVANHLARAREIRGRL